MREFSGGELAGGYPCTRPVYGLYWEVRRVKVLKPTLNKQSRLLEKATVFAAGACQVAVGGNPYTEKHEQEEVRL